MSTRAAGTYVTSTGGVSAHDHNDAHFIQRRTGGYHPNIWNDDIIERLSTPYGVIDQPSHVGYQRSLYCRYQRSLHTNKY